MYFLVGSLQVALHLAAFLTVVDGGGDGVVLRIADLMECCRWEALSSEVVPQRRGSIQQRTWIYRLMEVVPEHQQRGSRDLELMRKV